MTLTQDGDEKGEAAAADPAAARLYDVRLVPHRSMNAANFRVLMLVFGAAGLFTSLPFVDRWARGRSPASWASTWRSCISPSAPTSMPQEPTRTSWSPRWNCCSRRSAPRGSGASFGSSRLDAARHGETRGVRRHAPGFAFARAKRRGGGVPRRRCQGGPRLGPGQGPERGQAWAAIFLKPVATCSNAPSLRVARSRRCARRWPRAGPSPTA